MFKVLIKSIGAIFFISAASISVFPLGVPFLTGLSGFFPGLLMTFFVWLFPLSIGLLYLEAILSLPDGSNFFTMVRTYFGKSPKWFWGLLLLFIILNYPSITFSLYALSASIQKVFSVFGFTIPELAIQLMLSILIGTLLFLGLIPCLIVNFFLSCCLFYVNYLFLKEGSSFVTESNLAVTKWNFILFSIPLLYSAWGFQSSIPTLSTFLNRNRKVLMAVVFFGTFIPLLCYISFEWLLIGSLQGEQFWIAIESREPWKEIAILLSKVPWMDPLHHFLSFFGVFSSFLVNAYVLLDIFFDAIKCPLSERKGKKRLFLILAIFVPCNILFFIIPKLIIDSLIIPFFIAILLSFVTISAVWNIRYRLKLPLPHLLFGGKSLLLFLATSFFFFLWMRGISLWLRGLYSL